MCLVFPIYYLYFLAFAYGAATKSETEYDKGLASSIIQTLDSLGFQSGNVLIFDGIQPNYPVLENSNNIKIIKRLVPLYISNQWIWGYAFMRHQGLQFTSITTAYINGEISRICKSVPVLVTERYKIYRDNGTFIVAFENGGACFKMSPMK